MLIKRNAIFVADLLRVKNISTVQKMPKILFDRLKMRSHQIAYFFVGNMRFLWYNKVDFIR